jgi:hypothetical protein
VSKIEDRSFRIPAFQVKRKRRCDYARSPQLLNVLAEKLLSKGTGLSCVSNAIVREAELESGFRVRQVNCLAHRSAVAPSVISEWHNPGR